MIHGRIQHLRFALFFCEIQEVPAEIIINATIFLLLLFVSVIFAFYAPKVTSCLTNTRQKVAMSHYSKNILKLFFKYF